VTVTTEAPFYDSAMCDPHEPAMIHLDQSPWLELYQWASWIIPQGCPIVDLGCGTGRFAEQIRRRNNTANFVGFDFSPAAITECKRYVPAWAEQFHVQDLREWKPDEERLSNTVYTCLETLEHLDDDVSLVRRIPVGHEFVFSVPNFGGEAHLRTFQNVSDAWLRYGLLLDFTAWHRLGTGPRNFVHLYRATRRNAW
jgi:trans-aconitate methyltransferase